MRNNNYAQYLAVAGNVQTTSCRLSTRLVLAVGCSGCYRLFIFFVIIFKIFILFSCLYKNKSYLYTIEITTTLKNRKNGTKCNFNSN